MNRCGERILRGKRTAEKEASENLPRWREELLKLVEEVEGEPASRSKTRPQEAMGSGSQPRGKPPKHE